MRRVSGIPHLRLYRIGTGAAFIAAPVLFLADNLLHPKELERGNEVEQLAAIADGYTRWQAAHALGFLAIIAFAAMALGLAFLVRRRRPTAGLVGGALALAGALGLAAVITIDGFAWAIVGEASTKPEVGTEAAAAVLKDMQESEWSYVYYLTPLAFIVGVIVLAVSAPMSTLARALLVLAVLMVGTETAIISNAYFIAGAVVFLAAGVAFAVPILQMSDEEFGT